MLRMDNIVSVKRCWVSLCQPNLQDRRSLAAEKQERKIAVEIKSFLSESRIVDLEQALVQYILYNDIFQGTEAERELYLALPALVFEELFEGDKFAEILLDNHRLKLISRRAIASQQMVC